MTYKRFWELIGLGSKDPDALRRELEQCSEADMVDWYSKYQESVADIQTDEFTQHLTSPYSEDHLDDLAMYVVEQGEDHYEDVAEEPAKFPRELPADARPGTLASIVLRAYQDRFGTTMRMPDEPPPDTAE